MTATYKIERLREYVVGYKPAKQTPSRFRAEQRWFPGYWL
jgi:hypothetical protein